MSVGCDPERFLPAVDETENPLKHEGKSTGFTSFLRTLPPYLTRGLVLNFPLFIYCFLRQTRGSDVRGRRKALKATKAISSSGFEAKEPTKIRNFDIYPRTYKKVRLNCRITLFAIHHPVPCDLPMVHTAGRQINRDYLIFSRNEAHQFARS